MVEQLHLFFRKKAVLVFFLSVCAVGTFYQALLLMEQHDSSSWSLMADRSTTTPATIISENSGSHNELSALLNRHDSNSLPTYLWKHGKLIFENNQVQSETLENATISFLHKSRSAMDSLNFSAHMNGNRIVIDAMSIGCHAKRNLFPAQVASWAKHGRVRWFFGTTEADDIDPMCARNLSTDDVVQITAKCHDWRKLHLKKPMALQAYFHFAWEKWILKKPNPAGWLCAIQRVGSVIRKLGRFYQRELERLGGDEESAFPDYFFLQDDDTYWNMTTVLADILKPRESMEESSAIESTSGSSIPYLTGGCIVMNKIKRDRFSYPWGGYGFIMSRGALRRLIRPVSCSEEVSSDVSNVSVNHNTSEFSRAVCNAVVEDRMGESLVWKDGMSVAELIGEYTDFYRFTNHALDDMNTEFRNQSRPRSYCIHGDWTIGYFFNFYQISSQYDSKSPFHPFDGQFGNRPSRRKSHGNCDEGNETYVMHHLDANQMMNLAVADG